MESMNSLLSNLGHRIAPTEISSGLYIVSPTFRGMIRIPSMYEGLLIITARKYKMQHAVNTMYRLRANASR